MRVQHRAQDAAAGNDNRKPQRALPVTLSSAEVATHHHSRGDEDHDDEKPQDRLASMLRRVENTL